MEKFKRIKEKEVKKMGKNIIAQVTKEMAKEKEAALKTGDTEKELSAYSYNYCSDHHEYNDVSLPSPENPA